MSAMRPSLRLVPASLLLLTLAACGGGGGSAEPAATLGRVLFYDVLFYDKRLSVNDTVS
jgi:hypothetical protein